MYDEERKKNEYKTRRIRQLERIIIDLGAPLPKDTFGASKGETGDEDLLDQAMQ